MSADNSPLNRSIGLSGVLRWLITIAAVIAIGAAAVAGRFGMAAALAVFVVLAAVLGYRTSRTES